MSAHTPGPWAAIEWNGHAATTVVADRDGDRTVIAECAGNGRQASESLADARLVAAAPNLLETLRVARESIQEDRDILFVSTVAGDGDTVASVPDEDDREAIERYDTLLRVIDADIALATGEPA